MIRRKPSRFSHSVLSNTLYHFFQLLRRECLQDGTGIEVGEQPMVMYANGEDLIVSLRNVPLGWQLHGQSHQVGHFPPVTISLDYSLYGVCTIRLCDAYFLSLGFYREILCVRFPLLSMLISL